MNIDFTKEEYRLLVDMLHIAQQVINPNLFRGEETKKEYHYSLYNTTMILEDVELTDNCGVDRAHFLLTISTLP